MGLEDRIGEVGLARGGITHRIGQPAVIGLAGDTGRVPWRGGDSTGEPQRAAGMISCREQARKAAVDEGIGGCSMAVPMAAIEPSDR